MVIIYIIKVKCCEGEKIIGYTGNRQVAKEYTKVRTQETGYYYWYEAIAIDPNTDEIEEF